MDIYILNKETFERIAMIDEFKSFVWTERQSSYGDFEMTLLPGKRWANILIGRYIAHNRSKTVMRIEEKFETSDASGERVLKIKGRSIDSIMNARSVIPSAGNEVWRYKGTTGQAIYIIMRNFLFLENDMVGDRDIVSDGYAINGTRDSEILDFAISIKSVYDAVKELADTKNFTFGCELRTESPRLRFYVTEGVERDITFSTHLDTLTEPSFLESELDYYNTAYIWSKDGKYRTYSWTESEYRLGFDRRVLPVHASDLDLTEDVTTAAELFALMQQRGREELGKHKRVKAFDGALTGLDSFVYNLHYNLGDIVTLVDVAGRREKVRVSEYIFTQDETGTRDYPTFTAL